METGGSAGGDERNFTGAPSNEGLRGWATPPFMKQNPRQRPISSDSHQYENAPFPLRFPESIPASSHNALVVPLPSPTHPPPMPVSPRPAAPPPPPCPPRTPLTLHTNPTPADTVHPFHPSVPRWICPPVDPSGRRLSEDAIRRFHYYNTYPPSGRTYVIFPACPAMISLEP